MMPIIYAIIAAVIGIGSIFYFKQVDNPVEQVAEEVIKQETGIDIDLSPEKTPKAPSQSSAK